MMKINWFKIHEKIHTRLMSSLRIALFQNSKNKSFCELLNFLQIGIKCKDCKKPYYFCYCNYCDYCLYKFCLCDFSEINIIYNFIINFIIHNLSKNNIDLIISALKEIYPNNEKNEKIIKILEEIYEKFKQL